MTDRASSFFSEQFGTAPEIVASAPGRIEFIGNHTDYNGGCVIGGAIDRRTYVALRSRTDNLVRLVSDQMEMREPVEVDTSAPIHGSSWTRYPLAVLRVLHTDSPDRTGFDMTVVSNVPVGGGLSSSAALEMATAAAVAQAQNRSLSTLELVHVAHRAETQFVGVPCGLLDQTVSGFGRADRLVLVNAHDGSHRLLPVDEETRVWIIETHESHALDTSLYATRRSECERALSLLSNRVPGLSRLTALHAADLTAYGSLLPEVIRRRAEHVVKEQARVLLAERLTDRREIGDLLFASHASSSRLFENSTEALDFIVDALREMPGVLGARLTGGGFGGSAMAWVDLSFKASDLERVVENYTQRFGQACRVFPVDWSDGVRIDVNRGGDR